MSPSLVRAGVHDSGRYGQAQSGLLEGVSNLLQNFPEERQVQLSHESSQDHGEEDVGLVAGVIPFVRLVFHVVDKNSM